MEEDNVWESRHFDVAVLRSLMNAFVTAFNHEDLAQLVEIIVPSAQLPGLGDERAALPGELTALWERDPWLTASPGWHEGDPVVVLWTRLGEDWTRAGAIALEGDLDGLTRAQLVIATDEAAGLVHAAVAPPPAEVAGSASRTPTTITE